MMKVERLIGGALGLVAFAAIVTVSALKGVPFAETVFRALAGLGVGVLVGWWLFGPLGLSIARDAAGPAPTEPAPEKPGKKTDGEPSSPPEEGKNA